jgi:predicted N-acetyltransferase YhbS
MEVLMTDTKEKILLTALRLFAQDGYKAVSVSSIAGELGMTKGALYKHYKSKREIFDSIVERMFQIDNKRANEYEVPEDTFDKMPEAYRNASMEKIKAFTQAQYHFWTEDAFACYFRRILTLEQYRNPEMANLYQKCLGSGVISYMEDLFREMMEEGVLAKSNPKQLALEFYAPLYLLISMFDTSSGKEELVKPLTAHINDFIKLRTVKTKEITMKIRLEIPDDYVAVECLTLAAFNTFTFPDGSKPACVQEHYLAHIMRGAAAFVPELDFVGEVDGEIAANIMFTKSTVVRPDESRLETLTFGPVSVKPELQKHGLGAKIIRHSLDRARELGFGAVIIIGHPEYYPRFGFKSASGYHLTLPDGSAIDPFMALELKEGYLGTNGGKWYEDDVFKIDRKAFEDWNRQFTQ